MNNICIKKYVELSKNNKNLCFKFRFNEDDNKISFILGIITDEGPICFRVNESLYDEIKIRELYDCFEFPSYIIDDDILFEKYNFENINYFVVKDDELYYYFGNIENVVIPKNIKKIRSNCFIQNDKIKYVKGESVSEISYYAFKDNINLQKIEFINATMLLNILNVPNLQELVIGDKLKRFSLEDDIISKVKISIISKEFCSTYYYNDNLDAFFLEHISVEKDNDDNVNVVMINGQEKKYKLTKDSNLQQFDDYIVGICKYENLFNQLPNFIKQLLIENKYMFYIVENFLSGGIYIDKLKTIIYDFDSININFFHEIGHAIDFFLGKISASNSFRKIYVEEKDKLYHDTDSRKMLFLHESFLEHIIESESEFFAECFQRYCEKDNFFPSECPMSYNFIEKLLFELEKQSNFSNDEGSKKLKRMDYKKENKI